MNVIDLRFVSQGRVRTSVRRVDNFVAVLLQIIYFSIIICVPNL